MTEHPAIAALRATAPSTANMLPWNGNHGRFCVRNAKDGLVADTFWPEDRDHIVAAVNAAPVMLAELDALRAQVAVAREIIGVLKWADHSILCAVTAVDRGPCNCGADEGNRRLAAAVAALGTGK